MGKNSQLKRLDGHPYFYQNPVNQLISYIKGSTRIHTGETSIKTARKIAEEELIKRFSANPNAEKRKRKGISNPLISDMWVDLMKDRAPGSEESTTKGYQSSWKVGIEPFWGDRSVMEINAHNITQWENWYLKYHSTRTFFNTRKHFVMLMNYLKKQGIIQQSYDVKRLDDLIVKKTKRKKVGRVFTYEELKLLEWNAVDKRTYLGIVIYRHMGLRKNELLKSKRSHWNVKKAEAEIWSYKNKKWRTLPIPAAVLPSIESWLEDTAHLESQYLFPADTNPLRHISSQVFDTSWTKTKELAGISDWNVKNAARIHDLRHTFATWTYQKNWHPLVACKWLDMSLKEYERTYCHVSTEDLAELMRKSMESK
jgi:integrase